MDRLLRDVTTLARLPLGAQRNNVAGSACKVVFSLLTDSREVVHAPGPNGMVGGYPVRMSASGVTLALPEGISVEEAIRINEVGLQADGIERIEDGGTAVFTDASHEAIKEVFGFDCKRIPIAYSEEIAREFASKVIEVGQRHGVRINAHLG